MRPRLPGGEEAETIEDHHAREGLLVRVVLDEMHLGHSCALVVLEQVDAVVPFQRAPARRCAALDLGPGETDHAGLRMARVEGRELPPPAGRGAEPDVLVEEAEEGVPGPSREAVVDAGQPPVRLPVVVDEHLVLDADGGGQVLGEGGLLILSDGADDEGDHGGAPGPDVSPRSPGSVVISAGPAWPGGTRPPPGGVNPGAGHARRPPP